MKTYYFFYEGHLKNMKTLQFSLFLWKQLLLIKWNRISKTQWKPNLSSLVVPWDFLLGFLYSVVSRFVTFLQNLFSISESQRVSIKCLILQRMNLTLALTERIHIWSVMINSVFCKNWKISKKFYD